MPLGGVVRRLLQIPHRPLPVLATLKMQGQRCRVRAGLRPIPCFLPSANAPMQPQAPAHGHPCVDHLLMQGMLPAIPLGHRPIGPGLVAAGHEKLAPLRQASTAVLHRLHGEVQPGGYGGHGARAPSHARRFQHPLLLRAEPIELLLDHLPHARRHLPERRGGLGLHLPQPGTLPEHPTLEQVLYHHHQKERMTVCALVHELHEPVDGGRKVSSPGGTAAPDTAPPPRP
jgi:hypothetical protein